MANRTATAESLTCAECQEAIGPDDPARSFVWTEGDPDGPVRPGWAQYELTHEGRCADALRARLQAAGARAEPST